MTTSDECCFAGLFSGSAKITWHEGGDVPVYVLATGLSPVSCKVASTLRTLSFLNHIPKVSRINSTATLNPHSLNFSQWCLDSSMSFGKDESLADVKINRKHRQTVQENQLERNKER